MLARDTTIIKWNKANKKYYQQLGYVFTNYGDELEILVSDLSSGSTIYVKAVCDFCKKEYDVQWFHYLDTENKNQKHACYNCRHVKRYENDLEIRRNKLYLRLLDMCNKTGYTLLSDKSEIQGISTYIRYSCPLHGEHVMKISNFLNKKGCPDCVSLKNQERFKLSPDEVEKRINDCGGRLLNKEDYKNQAEKNLWVECFECGKPFLTSLRNFTQHGGQVCSECKNTESIGESKIKYYLKKYKINFIFQKWFDNCRDKNPLPFDFYLVDFNTIIEFDGRQHFEETEHFTYPLEMVQKHDKIKNDYCKNNGIHLIRIPYWNINKIETILDKELILHEDIV